MTTCPCCPNPIVLPECTNHRAWVIPGLLYAIMFEHSCGSSRSVVMYELDDGLLCQDGELSGRDGLSDLREAV
jgi:hypothetical protein